MNKSTCQLFFCLKTHMSANLKPTFDLLAKQFDEEHNKLHKERATFEELKKNEAKKLAAEREAFELASKKEREKMAQELKSNLEQVKKVRITCFLLQ